MGHDLHGAGKSSYDLIDTKLLFSGLALRPGSTFLDLGCGRGNYAIAAAELIGETGHVYAVDAWEEGMEQLKSALKDRGIRHVSPILADIGQRLPFEDHSMDVCFAATVFHDLVRENVHHQALLEVKRTLKEDGTLAVVEFKKFAGKPGPSIEVKLSPGELVAILAPHGFFSRVSTEIGPHNYLTIFGLL